MKVGVPEAVGYLWWSGSLFWSSCNTAKPAEQAALWEAVQTHESWAALFLRAAIDPEDFSGTWKPALGALRSLFSQYAWDSPRRQQQVAEIAQSPRLVAAAQTAAMHEEAPMDLLAVLARDGSEASVDALMPHFQRAQQSTEALARFDALRVYLKATAWTGPMRAALDARPKAESPVNQLAHRLGVASGPRFRVQLFVEGVPLGNGDAASATLELDGRKDAPRLSIGTADGNSDVECAADDLPKVFAQWAKTLKVRWNFEAQAPRHLKGRRLARFLDWLKTGV